MIERGARKPSYLSKNLVTLGIILAILGLEVAVGMTPLLVGESQIRLSLLLAVVGAIVVSSLSIKRIEYGIILLPIVAVAIPFAVGTGTQSSLVASMLFAAFLMVLWVARMLLSRKVILVKSPVNLPLLGFVLTAVLATMYSDVVRPPLVYVSPTFGQVQIGGLGVWIISAGVLLLVMNSIREMRWLKWLVWGFLAIGAVAIVGYFVRSGRDLPGFNTGGVFSLWVVSLAFGQAIFNDKVSRLGRVGLMLIAAAWLYRRFLLEDSWLSGWVPAFVAVLVISSLRPTPLSLLVAAGVASAILLRYDLIYGTQMAGQESTGNFLRLEIWSQNIEVTKDHLLLGTGIAGYAPYYMTFFPDRAYASHSNYLDTFSQTGLIGSFFLVWFLLAMFSIGISTRRRWPAGFSSGFANGALGGLAGLVVVMALGDWFIPFVYNQTIAGFRFTVHSWLFLGALAALQRIGSE